MGLAVTKVSNRRRGPIKDTSARKRTKPALSKEYQVVFEKTGKAMVIVEEDATISLVNAEFENLSGFKKKEIEGKKNWSEFVARDDRKRVKEYHLLRRTDPMLAPRSFEFRFLDRQEKVKNIILTIGQIPGTNKSMASLLDVTDSKQAEEMGRRDKKTLEDRIKSQTAELVKTNEALQAEIAELKSEVETLREINERNRTLIDNIDRGINLIDANHNIVMVNAAGSKQINKSVRELIGKKCFREFEKRDAVCPHCPGVQTIANGKFAEVETEGVRDDGSRYDVRIQTYPVFGHNGAMTGFIEIVEDISERKQAEKLLQQEKETFFTILQNALYGVALMESDGKHIYVNPEFTAITGYTLDDIPTGKDWMHKAFPDKAYRQEVTKLWRKDSKLGGTRRVVSIVCKNGETKEIETSRTPLENGLSVAMLVDITDRKQMEEELRESEKRFKTLAEHAPLGISIMAPDRSFEYLNPRFTEIFGYTTEDIPDKDTWFEKAYPNKTYRKKVISIWKRDVAEEGRTGDENPRIFTVRCKNGQDKIIDFRSVDLIDGKQYQVYEDITVRAKAEEALGESEERYRTLAENVKFGLNLIDADYNIVMVNTTLSKAAKKTASELIGKKCFREYEKRDAVCPHCPGAQAMATGKPAEIETERVRDDGSPSTVRYKAFPVVGEDGTASGFIEVIEDITKRKQIEKELLESRQELQSLMDASPVAISWADLEGNIQYINRKHHELFGYTLADIPTVADWQHQADHDPTQRERFDRWMKDIREAQKYGKPLPAPQEMTVTCKDSSIRYVTVGVTVVSNRTLVIYNDITERKRAEDQLKRYAAELERSNEEVKNFAYIVSHDLRVPLVNLKGYTSELHSALEVVSPTMETALPHLTEDKRSALAMALHEDVPEALEFITNSVSRMDSFINSVLILSRLGRRELKPEPIDMNALVQASLETLSHQIQERGTTVIIGSLPQLVADRTAMEQIIGNILGNAVKYLDSERPGQIDVTAQTNNGEQIFRIRDNGRGIAQEDMHKVFAPFRRAGKEDTPGEGMGLAYVQTLVRRHNGRIWCESELGKGTTFTFTISQNRAEGGGYVAD